ncbi:O-antigen export system permease protein RfbD [hydrothermal vent metagenome]|uniref:O-antigen export system permease protein RfbD n=1 Tax=hydrothermal vent metagenome TaxID=652676 RepID=A0A3B1BUW7_9ZZZZ
MFKTCKESLGTILARRELITILVSKELKSRYRGSALGMMWTFLNPLLLLVVYALVFSVYMRIQVENYAVFVFVGLLPWIWFSSSLTEGVNSITQSGSLITKSMFPAEILPIVKVISNLMNYLFSLPLLFIFIIVYGVPITISLLWLPIVMLAQTLITVGLVYFFSTINVRFRDTQHILNNFLILWFFLCPIIYPISQVPEEYRWTFNFNPIALLTIAYQDILIHGARPSAKVLGALLIIGFICTVIGFWTFEKNKEMFAEEI